MTTITLATLPQATAQQVFDQVATHLLTQGKKALLTGADALTGGTHCAYRGAGGTKCAAGSLISDDEYVPKMEGNNWESLCSRALAPRAHLQLILYLQEIHDNTRPEVWRSELEHTALALGLSTKVLD